MVEARGLDAALAYGTTPCMRSSPADVAAKFKTEYGSPSSRRGLQDHGFYFEGQYDPPVLVSNKIPQTLLKVVKADIQETGKRIRLRRASNCTTLMVVCHSIPTHRTRRSWTRNHQ